jgi:hypothetical protein
VVEHLGDSIRPAFEQARGQPRLEGLHRATGLEPDLPTGNRHAQHRRPRSLMRNLDCTRGSDARTNPRLDLFTSHTRTIIRAPLE